MQATLEGYTKTMSVLLSHEADVNAHDEVCSSLGSHISFLTCSLAWRDCIIQGCQSWVYTGCSITGPVRSRGECRVKGNATLSLGRQMSSFYLREGKLLYFAPLPQDVLILPGYLFHMELM